jgi:hypothetical protein
VETDQGPIPVIITLLALALVALCYALTGSPFPPIR